MLNLVKDAPLSLKKADETPAQHIIAGVGWDPSTEGATVDLDLAATVFNGVTAVETLFYGTPNKTADGKLTVAGMVHSGDDRTGDSSDDGPDEEIKIDLAAVNGDRVELIVNLYDAGKNGQTLGIAKNAFVQVGGDVADARFTMTEAMTGFSMHIGTLSKGDAGWSFTPHGKLLGDVDLNGAIAAVTAGEPVAA